MKDTQELNGAQEGNIKVDYHILYVGYAFFFFLRTVSPPKSTATNRCNMHVCVFVIFLIKTLTNPKSSKSLLLVLPDFDGVLHSESYVAMYTKSIKLHQLLLLDSGLCSQAMDILHLLLYQFKHSKSSNGGTFLLHFDGFWQIWDGFD